MAANDEQIFNDAAYARLNADISASATSIDLISPNLLQHNVNSFKKNWESGEIFYAVITNADRDLEVVKVTNISGNTLTVERGQDGSTAQAWCRGSVIAQRLTAAVLDSFIQKEGFRTIYFNPNGLLTGDYPGEEVYESGSEACSTRWWKNIDTSRWRLMAGTTCDYNYVDVDGFVQGQAEYPMYIFGGESSGTEYQTTWEYDPDTWTAKTDMPAPERITPSGCSIEDKCYSFGGYGVAYYQDCDEYNPSTNAWTAKTDMPAPARARGAAGVYNDKGYMFGGKDAGGAGYKDTDEYDPDTWTSKTDMNANSFFHGCGNADST